MPGKGTCILPSKDVNNHNAYEGAGISSHMNPEILLLRHYQSYIGTMFFFYIRLTRATFHHLPYRLTYGQYKGEFSFMDASSCLNDMSSLENTIQQ